MTKPILALRVPNLKANLRSWLADPTIWLVALLTLLAILYTAIGIAVWGQV